MTGSIPPLASLSNDNHELQEFLSLLLEPSDTLREVLVPEVFDQLKVKPPAAYGEILDICKATVQGWSYETKEDLISGHPLIGEVQGLSGLSSKEQGNHQPTPKPVLLRLAHLNALYTKIYPGLPYITFVAGRSRETIAGEIEQRIGIDPAKRPLSTDNQDLDQPSLDSNIVKLKIVPRLSTEWTGELDRAVDDVWKIGAARLAGLLKQS